MFVLPLMGSLPDAQHINLNWFGIVEFAGSVFVLLFLGKKMSYLVAIRYNPDTSFFLESACSLSGDVKVNNLEGSPTEQEEGDGYIPLLGDTLLY